MQNHPDEEDEDAGDTSYPITEHRPPRKLGHLVSRIWNPRPIPKPQIAPDLAGLSWIERSAEVTVHALLCLEHWLSHGGLLREWIRLNLWIALTLTLAVVLVIPPVTAILEGVRDMTELLSTTLANISGGFAKLPPIVLTVATVFLLVKLFQRRRAGLRHQRGMTRDDYDSY